jgi:hypothetical protein
MLGLVLLALGAVALWAAFTGRATAVLTALKMDLPQVGQGNAIVSGTTGSDGSSTGSDSSGSTTTADSDTADSGQHSAMTDGGLVYIINSTYADMTDSEKHDANNYANQVGNLGSI